MSGRKESRRGQRGREGDRRRAGWPAGRGREGVRRRVARGWEGGRRELRS